MMKSPVCPIQIRGNSLRIMSSSIDSGVADEQDLQNNEETFNLFN